MIFTLCKVIARWNYIWKLENEKKISGKVFSFLGEAAPEKNICNVARPRRTRGWPPADCSEEGVMHPLPPLSCNIAEAACSKTQCATFCGASVPYQSAYRIPPFKFERARGISEIILLDFTQYTEISKLSLSTHTSLRSNCALKNHSQKISCIKIISYCIILDLSSHLLFYNN